MNPRKGWRKYLRWNRPHRPSGRPLPAMPMPASAPHAPGLPSRPHAHKFSLYSRTEQLVTWDVSPEVPQMDTRGHAAVVAWGCVSSYTHTRTHTHRIIQVDPSKITSLSRRLKHFPTSSLQLSKKFNMIKYNMLKIFRIIKQNKSLLPKQKLQLNIIKRNINSNNIKLMITPNITPNTQQSPFFFLVTISWVLSMYKAQC